MDLHINLKFLNLYDIISKIEINKPMILNLDKEVWVMGRLGGTDVR